MKKLLIASLLTLAFWPALRAQEDPVVMKIDSKEIRLSEFEYLWNKNKGSEVIDQKTLDEYVDLFVVFKLKVAEAEALGMDTLKTFRQEFKSYRDQLTSPYLTDAEAQEAAREETYQMACTYLELSHILFELPQHPLPQDTIEAYQKALKVRNDIVKGKIDFAKAAETYTDDNNGKLGGYLGTTVGSRFIYPFAKAAMALKDGEISQPVRSDYGFHLIKMHHKEFMPGQYESGHIFKAVQRTDSPELQESARQEIQAIHEIIRRGAQTFEEMADQRNDDRYVMGKGGRYPVLRGGSLPYEYESHIFRMQDGEVSEPFQSDYGWHIVKRYALLPAPTKEDMAQEISQLVRRNEQNNVGRNALADRLADEYHLNIDQQAVQAFAEMAIAVGAVNSGLVVEAKNITAPLATFDENEVLATDLAIFMQTASYGVYYTGDALKACLREKLLLYEDSRLEKKYPQFGHLMQEYHDGILLFDISNQSVWEKAGTDTAGLEAFFEQNRANYAWEEPRFKGSLVLYTDAKLGKSIKKAVKKLPQDSIASVLYRRFNNDSVTFVRVERGLYAKGSKPMVDKVVFKQGDWEASAEYPYILPVGKVLKAPETISDVRSSVISDYQSYLESLWVEELRSKHTVEVFPDVLQPLR